MATEGVGEFHQKKWVYTFDCSWTSISLKIVSCYASIVYRPHKTYHLEGVQLLFDLLSEHRCQPVAGCNLSSTIILSARPGIMKLNSWAEANVPGSEASRRTWYTLGFAARKLCQGKKVIITFNGDRIRSSVAKTRSFVSRGTGRARAGRFVEGRKLGNVEIGSFAINWHGNRGRIARVRTSIRAYTGSACSVWYNSVNIRFKMPFLTAARTSARSLSPPTMLRL